VPTPVPAQATTLLPPAGGPNGGPGNGTVAAKTRPTDADAGPAAGQLTGPETSDGKGIGGAARFRGARSELRRQLREQKRIRAMALAVVVVVVLGAPMLYFGIVFATRDPVLNSLDRLQVPSWAAESAEDRIISGSRWCFIDCRFRERVLISQRDTPETTEVYQAALLDAGWTRWEVEGCPQVEVDGDYTCWTRDEYTLDLWVHPPECAYDPLNLRPDVTAEDAEDAEGAEPSKNPEGAAPPADGCTGSVVEIKMQNRVADERGLSGPSGEQPGPPGGTPEPTSPAPTATTPPAE
jgi:hypothetical protein